MFFNTAGTDNFGQMPDDLIKIGKDWFATRGWTPFQFQIESWNAYLNGESGLVNAPTGSGKTYSLMLPTLLEFIRDNANYKTKKKQWSAGYLDNAYSRFVEGN